MLGFGWESIFVYAAGLEYQVTSKMPVRIGYSFNENPIPADHCFYNVSSPAVVQNRIAGGLSYNFSNAFSISLAGQYAFQNTIVGEWVGAAGPAQGTTVETTLSTFFMAAGLQYGF